MRPATLFAVLTLFANGTVLHPALPLAPLPTDSGTQLAVPHPQLADSTQNLETADAKARREALQEEFGNHQKVVEAGKAALAAAVTAGATKYGTRLTLDVCQKFVKEDPQWFSPTQEHCFPTGVVPVIGPDGNFLTLNGMNGMMIQELTYSLVSDTKRNVRTKQIQSGTAPVSPASTTLNAASETHPRQTDIASKPLVMAPETRPPVKSAMQNGAARDMLPAKAATVLKINPPKITLQQMTSPAKPAAPGSAASAQTADLVAPTFTDPTNDAQLPMMPSLVAAPVALYHAAQLVARRDPVYPTLAKSQGISGSVELSFTISVEGTVRDVSVVNGNGLRLLVPAAVEALKGWRYIPARLNGNPVEAHSSAIFSFKPN